MFTKEVLGQKNKNELLSICKNMSIEVTNPKIINRDIIDLILLEQEDQVETSDSETLSPKQEIDAALARVVKMEEMYKQKLSEINTSQDTYKPMSTLKKKLSKDEISYREAQIVVKSRKGKSFGQLKRMIEKEMTSLHRVIVTEVVYKQYAHDAENNSRLVAWGNSIIGFKYSPVPFNIEYVLPLGVIKNLQNAKIVNVKTEEGNQNLIFGKAVNRYKVDILPQFTAEELVEMKETQLLSQAAGLNS
jgi:hypothetical protein